MAEYMIKPDELPVMLESLKELFSELGDNVTPRILAERMQLKTGRTYQYHQASYLLRMFGFVTRKIAGRIESRNSYFVVADYELIDKLIKESPQVAKRTEAHAVNLSPYCKEVRRTDINLFEPNLRFKNSC